MDAELLPDSLDNEDLEPPPRYIPSGRFKLAALVPWLVVGGAVALGMAYVLYLSENFAYYYLVTPLILGLPVFGAIWLAIRGAHCRNPALGGLIGITLGAVYYLGYWEISYRRNIVARGPGMVRLVQMIGGSRGLSGYVAFRCKVS